MLCDTFLWRLRWFILASFMIFTTCLIISTQNYRQPMKIPHYEVDFPPERYREVLKRWYDFSEVSEEFYNDQNISMFDDKLLMEIRDKWIIKYAELNGSYNLEYPQIRDPSMGQAAEIMKIFKNKKNGFFIECGAYDGETRSNTLVLERFFGWSGILIEADPDNFARMLSKKRKVHMSPTCLSTKPYPMKASFLMARNIGRLHEPDKSGIETSPNTMDVAHNGKHVTVQCFPLASYVAALDVETIDYFSLDVEGNEMEILRTIPFDKIYIKALSVEHVHGKVSREEMIDFMETRDYHVYSFVERRDNLANDIIFVKNEL